MEIISQGGSLFVLRAFEIRAQLDRALLESAGATVSEYLLTKAADLELLDHVWQYREGDGGKPEPVGWDCPLARPVQVTKLAANSALVPRSRAFRIAEQVESRNVLRDYDQSRVPFQATILTYAVGERRVIVDGNNSMATLAVMAGVGWPFMVIEKCVVGGPIDGRVLPDLYHYMPGGVPTELLKEPDSE